VFEAIPPTPYRIRFQKFISSGDSRFAACFFVFRERLLTLRTNKQCWFDEEVASSGRTKFQMKEESIRLCTLFLNTNRLQHAERVGDVEDECAVQRQRRHRDDEKERTAHRWRDRVAECVCGTNVTSRCETNVMRTYTTSERLRRWPRTQSRSNSSSTPADFRIKRNLEQHKQRLTIQLIKTANRNCALFSR
jgi:hypothetical protein